MLLFCCKDTFDYAENVKDISKSHLNKCSKKTSITIILLTIVLPYVFWYLDL